MEAAAAAAAAAERYEKFHPQLRPAKDGLRKRPPKSALCKTSSVVIYQLHNYSAGVLGHATIILFSICYNKSFF